MREVIKHRGAKVKLSTSEVDEIINFIISGDITFEDLANTYQVQLQYIKNIFNGKGRFKYLLGTERYLKMHEIYKKTKEEQLKKSGHLNDSTLNKNGRKTLRSMSQEELDILYTRLHNERTIDLATEYGIGQPQLSKLKHNKFKSFKGNLLVGEEESNKEDARGTDIKIVKDCDMPLPDEKFVKAELLDLARKTSISKELSIEDVLKNHLDCVGKSRLYDLLNKEEYLKHSIKNKFTNDMQTGLLIYEVLHLITSYSTFEIGMMIQEIKESKYED